MKAAVGTPNWSSTCANVRRAFEDYGCFIAVYDLIPKELRDEIFQKSEQLFNLPMETKMKNSNNKIPIFGYSFRQILESLGIEDSTNLEKVTSFSKLMWPPNGDHNFWYAPI